MKEPCLIILLVLLAAAILGLFFMIPAEDTAAPRKALDLATLASARADASLERAKELHEQSLVLLQKAEENLWAARLTEEVRNVCVSWYGKPYHGRLAASGVRFDMNERHVAHRWLPFGTKVVFYNPLNGTTSHGTVVDRGPFIDGRIFDLSYSMAVELGMAEQGIAIVRCWIPELPGELVTGRPSAGD